MDGPTGHDVKGLGGLGRCKGVEQAATEFASFYAADRDECLRVVLLNVGSRPLAEDLVEEAFTRAWMAWPKVRQHPARRAWVVRTALNAHISWLRRRRREVALAGHDVAAADRPDPVLDGDLARALRGLALRQREVVTLRLLLDLDTAATARLLGISPGTVGVHLHRALATLRQHLSDPSRSEQELTR